MFDIGFGEMMLLGSIALIAIGPKQLPEVARTVGRLLNEVRRASGEFTKTLVDARESTNQMLADANRSVAETVASLELNKLNANLNTPLAKPEPEPQMDLMPNTSSPMSATPGAASMPTEEQLAFQFHEENVVAQTVSPSIAPMADFGPETGPHKKES